MNPERVRQPTNPFRVHCIEIDKPRVLASSNPGLKLANAFGVSRLLVNNELLQVFGEALGTFPVQRVTSFWIDLQG